MKRLLVFVLLVLGLAADAGAVMQKRILIYSYQQKSTEYACDANLDWSQSSKTESGYLVVQWTAYNEVDVWTVKTGTDKDKEGKTFKYATADEDEASFSFGAAEIGKKTMWLVGSNSEVQHILLTGQAKTLFDGWLVASKLTGTSTWMNEDYDVLRIGTAVITLKWQSKLSADVMSDPDVPEPVHPVEWLLIYLMENKGYRIL